MIQHKDFTLDVTRAWIKKYEDNDLLRMIVNAEKNNFNSYEIWRGNVTMEEFKQILLDEKSRRGI